MRNLLLATVVLLAVALWPKDTPPYDAQLTSGYGAARARDGVGALNFAQRTMRPVLFLNMERQYPSMGLVGEVQITGWVTSSEGMTITAGVDADSRDSMILTMPCIPAKPPVGAPAVVSGTISTVSCPIDASGCVLSGPISSLGGNQCP